MNELVISKKFLKPICSLLSSSLMTSLTVVEQIKPWQYSYIIKQLLYNKCPKFDEALKFSTPLDAKKTIILSTSEHTFIF